MQEGRERDDPFLEGIVMASLRATDLYVVLWAASSKPQNIFTRQRIPRQSPKGLACDCPGRD